MVFELVLIIFGTVIGSFLNDLLDEYKPGMVAVIKRLCYALYFKYTDLIFNIKLWLETKDEDKNNEIEEHEEEHDKEDEESEEESDDTVIIKDE